jgi:hypothetical protein
MGVDTESTTLFMLISIAFDDHGDKEEKFQETVSKCLAFPYMQDGGSYAMHGDIHQCTRLALVGMKSENSDINLPFLLSKISTEDPQNTKSQSPSMQHRIYKLLNDRRSPDFDETLSKVLLVVGMQPGGDLTDEEFHSWYEEEHTPLFTKIPGWRRTRRAELTDSDAKAPRWLALHEWDSMASFSSEEYKYAISTEWRNSVVGRVDQTNRERLLMELV